MQQHLRFAVLTAVVATVTLTGCGIDSPNLGSEFPLGVIQVFAASDGQGGYIAHPRAEFFYTLGFTHPNSRSALDTCYIARYTNPLPPRQATYMYGGERVQLHVGGETYLLTPRIEDWRIIYELEEGLRVQPGQRLTFNVPGDPNGFPAMVISAPIGPAPSSISDIPSLPDEGQPIPVEWSPVGDDSSRVELALRYASPDAVSLDSQIICDWRDTGSNTVPANLLSGWRLAGSAQQIEFTRYRTQTETKDDAALFLITAMYSFVMPATPAQ